ncbi:MAG: hypothetical protein GY708_30185 [Actinomycetia bacterium]|nr:hypothetical protein [Actinomycetes bacterium]MCP4961630.1 hypothetical protein [Actinomycetes bacterium]
MPETSGPPDARFARATLDADATTVFVARSGDIQEGFSGTPRSATRTTSSD